MQKFNIIVGLKDGKTKKQKHFTKWYYKQIFNYCRALNIDGATLSEKTGFYKHDNGDYIIEKSIKIELLFISEETVKKLAWILLKAFNQESIIVEYENEYKSELIENTKVS